jgi:hypothetical protein
LPRNPRTFKAKTFELRRVNTPSPVQVQNAFCVSVIETLPRPQPPLHPPTNPTTPTTPTTTPSLTQSRVQVRAGGEKEGWAVGMNLLVGNAYNGVVTHQVSPAGVRTVRIACASRKPWRRRYWLRCCQTYNGVVPSTVSPPEPLFLNRQPWTLNTEAYMLFPEP